MTKQWLLVKLARVSQITRANLARRVTFFSKMAFGKFPRVWRVLPKPLANFGEFGESEQNRLANLANLANLASPAHF